VTWTPDLAAAFEAAVIAPRVSVVVRPDDPVAALLRLGAGALAAALPSVARTIAAPVVGLVESRAANVSVTVPAFLPGVLPVVVLSRVAVADPVSLSVTSLHEVTHAVQIGRAGNVQAVADYLSGELRAQREADAAAAGRWLRCVLTGELLGVVPLSDLYCLDAGDAALAVALMRSHVETMRAGLVPPLESCVAAARWLRSHPDVPEDIASRVPLFPDAITGERTTVTP
jgi:hypothetical protein